MTLPLSIYIMTFKINVKPEVKVIKNAIHTLMLHRIAYL